MLAHASMSPEILLPLFFGRVIFSHAMQNHFKRKIITKHNNKKTHINIFYNKLLGQVAKILELFLNFSDSIRIKLAPTL